MTGETLEQALTSPDFLIRLATELKTEQEARKTAEAESLVCGFSRGEPRQYLGW